MRHATWHARSQDPPRRWASARAVLTVREVEAQFVRAAGGAALVDAVTRKHLTQRPVDQVRRGVVGRNQRPPLVVHRQLRGLPHL
ncbi:MAG: hypothetical protein ACK56I_33360, partial [bacterium]